MSDKIREIVQTVDERKGDQRNFVLACVRYCLKHPECIEGWREENRELEKQHPKESVV